MFGTWLQGFTLIHPIQNIKDVGCCAISPASQPGLYVLPKVLDGVEVCKASKVVPKGVKLIF